MWTHLKKRAVIAMAGALLALPALGAPVVKRAEIVIYGATPAGLAAAEAICREGTSLIVVEPGTHIGGMITGGIAVTDTGTPHLVGGIAGEFFDEVDAETFRTSGKPGPAVLKFFTKELVWRTPRPWDLEPKTARTIFERWVGNRRYELLKNRSVNKVSKRGAEIQSIQLTDGTEIVGKIFIDASYEGDLMARAGVSYAWGRESGDQYGESLAGMRAPHFKQSYTEEEYRTPTLAYMHHGQFGADIPARDNSGKLLWGVEERPKGAVGSADKRVQAYCFRLIATQRPDLKLPWPKAARYDPQRYELLLRYINAHPGICFARLVHFGTIPNGKFDLNASGPFSIDYIGGNRDYPDGDYKTRERIYREHEDYEKGFLWFLANDPRVPQKLREDVNSWGLARDEFADTGNWPPQLYVREARRMMGEYVMTQHDVLKANTKADSVGMGSFVLDSHWVQRFENEQGFVRVEGHLDESINLSRSPYEISYRTLTPKREQCRNLLVPVCLSASHVAFCTIRVETVYMILGHSAGVAATMAVKSRRAVQDIDTLELSRKLREQRQVLHARDKKP